MLAGPGPGGRRPQGLRLGLGRRRAASSRSTTCSTTRRRSRSPPSDYSCRLLTAITRDLATTAADRARRLAGSLGDHADHRRRRGQPDLPRARRIHPRALRRADRRAHRRHRPPPRPADGHLREARSRAAPKPGAPAARSPNVERLARGAPRLRRHRLRAGDRPGGGGQGRRHLRRGAGRGRPGRRADRRRGGDDRRAGSGSRRCRRRSSTCRPRSPSTSARRSA